MKKFFNKIIKILCVFLIVTTYVPIFMHNHAQEVEPLENQANTEILDSNTNNVEEDSETQSNIKEDQNNQELEKNDSVNENIEDKTNFEDDNIDNNESLEVETKDNDSLNIIKSGHIQNVGWKNQTDSTIIGTTGQSLRLEAFRLDLEHNPNGIIYESHVQNVGWQGIRSNGEISGTTGQSLRLEAIRINLSEELLKKYNIYYRVSIAGLGWLDWAKNGEEAGSTGLSTSIEAIEIKLTNVNDEINLNTKTPYLENLILEKSGHIQNIGWKNQTDSTIIGTTGQSLRLEAIKLNILNKHNIDINYETHLSGYGWQGIKSNGEISGTTGQSRNIEAVRISLSNDLSNYYDIYYRGHVPGIGWLDWAKNGEEAGSTGLSTPIEAIEIKIMIKGQGNYLNTTTPYLEKINIIKSGHIQNVGWKNQTDSTIIGTTGQSLRLEAFTLNQSQLNGSISYNSHVQNVGWQGSKMNGQVGGTTGQSLRLEAVCIALHGELDKYYDIYYRSYLSGHGWLGWTKNGHTSGSTGRSTPIEAIEIDILPKGSNKYSLGNAYLEPFKQDTPYYYSQRDWRWANIRYNGRSMAQSGCVPTAVAMALRGKGINVNPNDVAHWLYYNTYEFNWHYPGGSGQAFKLGLNAWGVEARGVNDYNQLNQELSNGKMVLAMVDSRSPFVRNTTHALVLFQNNSGQTYVYDPYDSYKNGWYSTWDLWYNWRSNHWYDVRGGHAFVAVG